MGVKYDLFPAFVTMVSPDDPTELGDIASGPPRPNTARSYDKARVIVFHNKILIAIDGDNGPKILLEELYQEGTFMRSASRTEDSRLVTSTGMKLVFKRNDACGCGSRLRSWNPYRTLSSTKDPTE
jgi:hypothetical protein